MIQTLTTWKGISLNAESAITPIKTSAHWGSNVCRCFLQRWQYLDTTRVSVILWSVWNWLWKYGCMSPGLYFVSLNVMGFKLSWTRFPGLLHNTEGGHRTCSLPPPSQTHTHTHICRKACTHTPRPHMRTDTLIWEGTPKALTSADWKQKHALCVQPSGEESWVWLLTDDVYPTFPGRS